MSDIYKIDTFLDDFLHNEQVDKQIKIHGEIVAEYQLLEPQREAALEEYTRLSSVADKLREEFFALPASPEYEETRKRLNSQLSEASSRANKSKGSLTKIENRMQDLSSVDYLKAVIQILNSYINRCDQEILARHDATTEARLLQELSEMEKASDESGKRIRKLAEDLDKVRNGQSLSDAAGSRTEASVLQEYEAAVAAGKASSAARDKLQTELEALHAAEKESCKEYYEHKERHQTKLDECLVQLREAIQDKKIRQRHQTIPNYQRLQNQKISSLSSHILQAKRRNHQLEYKVIELKEKVAAHEAEAAALEQQLKAVYDKESDEIKLIRKDIASIDQQIANLNGEVKELDKMDLEVPLTLLPDEASQLKLEAALMQSEISEIEKMILQFKTEAKREGKLRKEVAKLEESEKRKRAALERGNAEDNYLKNELEDIVKQREEAVLELENFQKAESEEVQKLTERKSMLEAEIPKVLQKINQSHQAAQSAAVDGRTAIQSKLLSLTEQRAAANDKLKNVQGKHREQAKGSTSENDLLAFEQNLAALEKQVAAKSAMLLSEKNELEKTEAALEKWTEKEKTMQADLQNEYHNIKWQENNKKFSDAMDTNDKLLVVKNLKKYFPVEKNFFGRPTRYLRAVDDVSFSVAKGRTMGIVGESGCGKTTMGRAILKLHEITDGEVIFEGNHVEILNNREMQVLRPQMQIIFQDPYSSLSPRLPVGEIIGEAVRAHKLVPKSDFRDYIMETMKRCGLQTHYYSRYPHEFSGGQRQRICIARALALNPKLVICDEPVSALDVSIQAQIINLLEDLQSSAKLTYVFISHDLSVVEHISDDVGVMYLGSMVESGVKGKVFDNPMHPYTEALFSAVPVPDPNVKMNRIVLKGDIPSPANPPRGCKFHTRCHRCMDVCKEIPPVYKEYEPDHFVACHLYPQD